MSRTEDDSGTGEPMGGPRRQGRRKPRGRVVEAGPRADIDEILSGETAKRDRLIEYLHRLQDRFGHLSADHLAALAERLRLAETEVYEVATFYAHFDVVKAGEDPPPATTLRVCDGLPCAMAGAADLLAELRRALDPAAVRVLAGPCMGRCDVAPTVAVARSYVDHADADRVARALDADCSPTVPAEAADLVAYQAAGGYRRFKQLREGSLDPARILQELDDSGLRGLGGAGFPTGRKWRLVAEQPAPRLMAVNADEGEPGTFKDRFVMETAPHQFLEGMLIAASVIGAEKIYLYVRDEYPAARDIVGQAIADVVADGLVPAEWIELRRGAGAYICGEESAMLESLEGKRGLPRHKPPFPAEVGLFGRPTLINNVETLYWVPEILRRGGAWFAEQGVNGGKGLRLYSVSGRVREPGVKRAPVGLAARALIDDHCGGMAGGHRLKGYLPGGASGGILPASKADIPLDFGGGLAEEGCFIGSAAIIVLGDRDSARDAALNLMRFFEHESCGQCTPCRVGTEKAVRLMAKERWDAPLLEDLSRVMADASICGLGQAAVNPLLCTMRAFPEDAGL